MIGATDEFARQLLRWYTRHRRDLPWRPVMGAKPAALDPYHVLVSEAMLQQTQVATVIPYYQRFLAKFPTLQALAQADQQEVLRLWQGLGYYSRARNLQAAAQAILAQHNGKVPNTVEGLLSLPGVGRYTAGAVASIAYEKRAPILDGNVIRVLCRIDKIQSDPRDRQTNARLWSRAEEILPRKRIGDFNSAMMELGATVCTPKSPACLMCPVRPHCEATAAGLQEQIPLAKKAKPTPLERRRVYCIERDNKWLIEQRPPKGRWAGMWQFITTTTTDETPPAGCTKPSRHIGQVKHALTHRRYEFEIFRTTGNDLTPANPRHRWVTLEELDAYPLPKPHLKIVEILRGK